MKKAGSALSLTILAGMFCSVLAQGSDTKPADKSGSKSSSHVKVKYDKSKDLTTVTLRSMDLGGAMTKEVTNLSQVPQLTLDVFFTYPGERLTKPADSITMRFTSRARYPVYQRGQNLMAVLDDTTAIPLGGTSYKTNAQTFYTDEILEASMFYEVMKRIADAKNVKLFLGNREITFRKEQLQDLRDMTVRMSP